MVEWIISLLLGVVNLMKPLCNLVVNLTTKPIRWSFKLMVKIKYGGGVAQMSGSEAGRTYARNRGGAYIRNRTTPLNPNSTFQQTVRMRINELSKAWSADLTEAQRDGWTSFADSFPITDVFGESLTLTGSQMYVRINARLEEVGVARIDTAPINQDVDTLLTAVLTFDIGVGATEITFTPTPIPASHQMVIRMTPALSPGINFVNNRLRFVVSAPAAATSPVDVETAWTNRFGTLPAAGQKVVSFCHFINETTGAVSVAVRSDAIVVDT